MNEQDLHEYQLTAIDHILDHNHCGLFLDMGLGKTVSALTAIKRLMFEEIEIMNVLVIAPKRVAENVWDAECSKWEHLRGLKLVKIAGKEKERKQALSKKADIYLIGRDNIAWLCAQYGGRSLPFDMVVIDESSSFKNPRSVRFKAMRKVQASFKRVVILTGTPAPNGLLDLWSQIYLLDRGERLEKFLTRYRDEYFTPAKRNGHTVFTYALRSGAEEKIHSKISDICMSMRVKDYLELPERIENIIEVTLPPKIMQKYNDFEREQVLELFSEDLFGKQIPAVNAAALSNKLLQFANGAVYDENKNFHKMHDLKIEALKEVMENANGNPVLVAWTYRSDMMRILEGLKEYNPRQLKDSKDIEQWNAGELPLLMMHPASGGHGLNLQTGGHLIVWFGQSWSLELDQQFNARLDRQGQKKSVVVNRIVAKGTMDEDVIKAIKGKEHTQEALMNAVKSRINKYIK